VTASEYQLLYVFVFVVLLLSASLNLLLLALGTTDMKSRKSITVTYDHRLKRTGHPVRSAIHKLQDHLDNSLNRANRHSVEF
jgi:hypothetical protein